jgi:hypothetical protein
LVQFELTAPLSITNQIDERLIDVSGAQFVTLPPSSRLR